MRICTKVDRGAGNCMWFAIVAPPAGSREASVACTCTGVGRVWGTPEGTPCNEKVISTPARSQMPLIALVKDSQWASGSAPCRTRIGLPISSSTRSRTVWGITMSGEDTQSSTVMIGRWDR